MARILTICQHCGDVEVTPDEVSVQVWVGTDRGQYTLHCPTCAATTVWLANPETIDLLAASGAALETVPRQSSRTSPTASGHRPMTIPASKGAARRRRWSRGRKPHRRP